VVAIALIAVCVVLTVPLLWLVFMDGRETPNRRSLEIDLGDEEITLQFLDNGSVRWKQAERKSYRG